MLVNFESDVHLFNYCKKILRNNEVMIGRDASLLLLRLAQNYFDMFYAIPTENFCRIGIYHPINALTSETGCVENEEELIYRCSMLGSLLYSFTEIYKNKSINHDDRKQRYILERFCRIPYESIKGKIFTQKLIDMMNELYQISGVYLFFSEDKKLLYVGKSVNLGERILASLAERDGVHYIKYLTCVKSDISILETYLIASLKPFYNKDCACEEQPTIKIPTPEFSEFVVVYKEVETQNSIMEEGL